MEKRIYERISLPVKLKYEVKNRPKVIKETTAKNISGGGVCLPLNEKLPSSTKLTITIEIGKGNDLITLDGRVIWNRRVEIEGEAGPVAFYDTGIELIDADPININRVITDFYGKRF